MRAVPAVVYRLLGLLHPEWSLRLGPGAAVRRRRTPDGVALEHETRAGDVDGGAVVASVAHCCYDGALLRGVVLAGRCELSSLRGTELQDPTLGPRSRVEACDLTSVRWVGGGGADAELIGCALRDALLTRVELGALHLCDLSGARLEGVQLNRALACDLTGAQIIDCDLAGADLRGSTFCGARFSGGSLRGARVDGADFTGAQGIDAATRKRLMAAGARFQGAATARVIQRLRPGADPVAAHRLGRGLQTGGALLGVVLAAAGLWTALRPPPTPPLEAAGATEERIATDAERNRTRIALADLRAALASAHQTMLDNGATRRSWPTMVEFQENHFDLDGDGPGEVMTRLFPGQPPANYLTDSEGGVLPYCNDEPDQATISGVDTDWHYCEQTGRVFAGAGFSGQATLNW